jgi:hypothetical protein
VKHFRKYLLARHFIIYTDNSAVASLLNSKDPVGRIVRWTNSLMEFNFTLKHRSGKENIVADFLSRHPAYFITLDSEKELDYERIIQVLRQNDFTTLSSKAIKMVKKFVLINDLLYRKTSPVPTYVLQDKEETYELLKKLHDNLGHFGFETVYKWVRDRYWSRTLYHDVKHYVSSCLQCQRYQLRKPIYKFLGQSSIAGVFQKFAIDFLGPFPATSDGLYYCSSRKTLSISYRQSCQRSDSNNCS